MPKANRESRPGKGGKREGAGRPSGASTQLTRFELNKVAKSGKAPIDIMLKNMWWWDEQADAIGEQIQSSMADLQLISDDDKKLEELNKLKKKLDAFTHARDKAQACAVDAAPFCHAKLQSVAVKSDNKGKILEVETVVPVSNIGNDGHDGVKPSGSDTTRSYRDGYNAEHVIPIRRAG